MNEKRFLNPPALPPPFGYSHVVEAPAGRTLYISGQIALDAASTLVGAGDLAAQTEQVFANIAAALHAAGVGFEHIVKS